MAAVRVKQLRAKRGMSAAQLARRCADLGAPALTTNVIANIETRRRDVSVDDLLVFALALDVPPIHLLTPAPGDPEAPASMRSQRGDGRAEPGPAATFAVTPEVRVEDPQLVRRWIQGQEALPAGDARRYYSFALEHLPAPDTSGTLAQYAQTLVQDAGKRLAAQYEAQAAAFVTTVRGQVQELLTELEAAIDDGSAVSDVRSAVSGARSRLTRTAPPPTP